MRQDQGPSARLLFVMLAGIAFGISVRATTAAGASPEKIVLTPEQSTGGVVIHLADGTPAVTLDASCKDAGPDGAAIEWTTPSPLPAGWWHGTLSLSPREGEERSWVNTHVGVVLLSPESPMVNMMANGVFDEKNHAAQQFEFRVYTSASAKGVRVQSVYDGLYRYKRTWPIMRLTLEQADPPPLTAGDPVTLALTVRPDGSLPLPGALPPGVWALRAAMTKEGTMTCAAEDGRLITAPFAFDRWKHPEPIHFYLESPPRTIAFKGAALFKTVLLEHLVTRAPATPIPAERQVIETVDPGRSQSAELVMLGPGPAAEVPAFPLVPNGKKIVVMTTWDDGAPDDLRCAQVLQRHGYHPSFFMNGNSAAMKFLDKLEGLGAEVGSHCYHHPSLYELPPAEADAECLAMRAVLERELRHPVVSFAYPNGYWPAWDDRGDYVLRAVRAAGYWSGRTTVAARQTVESAGDPLTMPSDGFFGNAKDLERAWQEVRAQEGGVFYFWGHSWQIGKTDEQWKKFEDFVAQFANQGDAWYATQGEYSLWLWARKNVRIQATGRAADRVTVTLTRPWLHPYLAARCPLSLRVPAGVRSVLWQGKEVGVVNGVVELPWP